MLKIQRSKVKVLWVEAGCPFSAQCIQISGGFAYGQSTGLGSPRPGSDANGHCEWHHAGQFHGCPLDDTFSVTLGKSMKILRSFRDWVKHFIEIVQRSLKGCLLKVVFVRPAGLGRTQNIEGTAGPPTSRTSTAATCQQNHKTWVIGSGCIFAMGRRGIQSVGHFFFCPRTVDVCSCRLPSTVVIVVLGRDDRKG